MSEDMKPCPFCGGAARWGKCVPGEQELENDGAEYIECESCGASTCLVFPCMDDVKQPLRDRWNRRASEDSKPPNVRANLTKGAANEA